MKGSFVTKILFMILAVKISIGQRLSLNIDDFDQGVIVKGYTSTYIAMSSPSKRIKVTCNKINNQREGVIIAFVNKKPATSLVCYAYAQNSGVPIFNDFYCLSKTFAFDLTNEESFPNYFQIECKLVDSNLVVQDKLYKLYEDNSPRIRSGEILYQPAQQSLHNIDLESVSCESIIDTKSNVKFDGLQWYDQFTFLSNFNLPTDISAISENKRNLSNTFRLTPSNRNLYKPSTYYRCCTTLKGEPILCSTVYLTGRGTVIVDPLTTGTIYEPSTTTTVTTTTKPTTVTTTSTTSKPITKTTFVSNSNVLKYKLPILFITLALNYFKY